MAGRYVHLNENLYFDTQDKVIVKNMGNRYVFVRHDRRSQEQDIKEEKRLEAKSVKNLSKVAANLYFVCKTNHLYRKAGDKLVLYSKERRKTSKAVTKERRKIKPKCAI